MPKVSVDEFAKRLKLLRFTSGMTQKQAAEAVGMPESMWQKYEYGTREPSLGKAVVLADLFNVSLDYLTGRTDDPAVH